MSSSPLSADQVRRIAALARIAVSDEDVARLGADLSAVLGYMNRLGELDLGGVEPLTHVADEPAPPGEDIPAATLSMQTLAELAPQVHDRYVRIPKVLDDGSSS